MPISARDFEFMSVWLRQRIGLTLTPDKTYLVETRLEPVARTHGFADLEALVSALRAPFIADALLRDVTDAMTTHESMFFRDMKPFEILEREVFPALRAQQATSVRIWCAACSSGQEPYSIAMLLSEKPNLIGGMRVEIIGTDISDKVVERAKTGVYSQFEVQRGLPIHYLIKYFEQRPGNQWEVKPSIKSMVQFGTLNLLEPYGFSHKFDIVLCRNVLIYFDEDTKIAVLNRIAGVTQPPGYLFLGASESVMGLSHRWRSHATVHGLSLMA